MTGAAALHRPLAVAAAVVLLLDLATLASATGDGGTAPSAAVASPSAPEAADPATGPTQEAVGASPTPTPARDRGAIAASPRPASSGPPPEPGGAATTGPAALAAPWSVDVHRGLGAWVDVFDWSQWGSDGEPTVTPATMDALAAHGVRTVYLQTSRVNHPDGSEPELLQQLVDRAHANGMAVVGWYLPTFQDVEVDLQHVQFALGLDVDGFALDIESSEVEDVALRTRRLLELSARVRELAGDRTLVANVLPPVALEETTPTAWPGFPWGELDAYYDVVMPMAYFTFRGSGHGEQWRDAETYTAENVRRIRERVGDPELPVHVIGGIADRTTVEDVRGMTRGARATGAIGLSLYDVATTGTELWEPMRAWRELGR